MNLTRPELMYAEPKSSRVVTIHVPEARVDRAYTVEIGFASRPHLFYGVGGPVTDLVLPLGVTSTDIRAIKGCSIPLQTHTYYEAALLKVRKTLRNLNALVSTILTSAHITEDDIDEGRDFVQNDGSEDEDEDEEDEQDGDDDGDEEDDDEEDERDEDDEDDIREPSHSRQYLR